MSHEIEQYEDGSFAFAYAGLPGWHRLGKNVSGDLTPDQMLEEAGLNWDVEKVPLFADHNGKRIRTGAEALVRSTDSKILTIVTDSWNPLQNREAFGFFNEFVLAGDMTMETAGSLKGGRHVFGLAKIKESFELFNGKDQVDSYFLFSNPHQFGRSIDIRFTPIRVVCNNTLTLSLNSVSARAIKVNHRNVFDPEAVKETLGIAHNKFAKYKEMATFLSEKRYTAQSIIDYFNQVFPKTTDKKLESDNTLELHSRAANLAYSALDHQPGAELGAGTWWSAYNSVTYLADHVLGRNDDTRTYSAWFGLNQQKKVRALNLAVEMANAA